MDMRLIRLLEPGIPFPEAIGDPTHLIVPGLIILLAAFVAVSAQARTWTAADGKQTLPPLRNYAIGDFPPNTHFYRQGSTEFIPLHDLRGKLVLVHFWAPRDPASVNAMPIIVDLYKRYHPLGLEIVAVAVEKQRPVMNQMEEKLGIVWPTAQDRGSIYKAWGVSYLPALILIDQNGRIARHNLRVTETESVVRSYLGLNQ